MNHDNLSFGAPEGPNTEEAAELANSVPMQGGLSNDELLAAWRKKLPRIEPVGDELNAFALGVEVGYSLVQDELKQAQQSSRTYFLECNSARDAWRARVKQCEALEAAQTAAYAEGRKDEKEQCADPLPAAVVFRIRKECRALGLDDVAFAWHIQKAAASAPGSQHSYVVNAPHVASCGCAACDAKRNQGIFPMGQL